jgi:MFS family permease
MVISLGMGVFVGGFDQTFVVPVLSRILNDFSIPIHELGKASWVLNGYLLGYTVAMPLMGRVADVYGHLRVFVAGLAVFMAGSMLVALSPNLTTMALARALTALGGGALVPVSLAIAADALPARQRPLGLSTISVLDDASSLIGPLWGTLIGVWLGWRGLFWLNIALGAPVLLAVLVLARSRSRPRGSSVDWLGGALLTAGLTSLTFALADAGSRPRPLPQTLALYAGAALFLGAFVLHERRVRLPLIDVRIFRDVRLSAAFVVFLLEGGALITALVNLPLMAEVLWGHTGAGPGLVLMRMVLFMLAGGFLGGVLLARVGPRPVATAGFLLAAAGLFAMWSWPQVPGDPLIWATLAVAGVGFTLSDAPLYLVVIESVDAARRASSAALLQVFQTTGMIVGMALLASRGLGRFDRRAAELFATNPTEADTERYRALIHETLNETFLVAALVMLLAAALALLLRRPEKVMSDEC